MRFRQELALHQTKWKKDCLKNDGHALPFTGYENDLRKGLMVRISEELEGFHSK
ncbi:MAG: hypothetical protein ABI675_06675 [Chitinophagaceae bacterium]